MSRTVYREIPFAILPDPHPRPQTLMRILRISLLLLCCLSPASSHARQQEAHNIILMVADGMGLADVTAARIHQGGQNPPPLSFEKLPVIGYQRTSSANSVVTDSAAAASAFATGLKHLNGQISCGNSAPACSDPPPTILEIAKRRGKATGLVVTSTITHATPAAFGAHVASRLCEGEIGRQYILDTGVDILLGGGIGSNGRDVRTGSQVRKATMDDDPLFGGGGGGMSEPVAQDHGPCQTYANTTPQETIDLAKAKGYAVVSTKEDLFSAVKHSRQVLGLFGKPYKTVEAFRLYNERPYPGHEPTLAEMTQAALTTLSQDPEGFFLLVEGSQVDWRNHDNDTAGMIAEVLAFDAAVTVVTKQLEAWLIDPKTRKLGTLLMVVSDHETGGFAITGPDGQTANTGMIVESAWISKHHTGEDTVVWSQGPGSSKLSRAIDNTDLFQVMKEAFAP